MMGKSSLLGFLVLTCVMIGCTPTTETGVRRVKIGQSDEANLGREVLAAPVTSREAAPLDAPTRILVDSYGSTIKRNAERYGFDWRLVVAIMKVESGFSLDAESEKGASGLMQIMPATSEEVGRKLEIEDMAHPMNNIHGGIYYLGRLYKLFDGAEQTDRIRLTLAAYNAGAGRIYDAQDLAAYLRENPRSWQAVRDALPLLSKRYYTLHKNIWAQEKPRSGWFGGSKETVAYVDKVMRYYEGYRVTLN